LEYSIPGAQRGINQINASRGIKNFYNFQLADDDFDPICLKSKEWTFIKADIEDAVKYLPRL